MIFTEFEQLEFCEVRIAKLRNCIAVSKMGFDFRISESKMGQNRVARVPKRSKSGLEIKGLWLGRCLMANGAISLAKTTRLNAF